MRLRVPGNWSAEEEARHAAWLAAVDNAFVNALRPRIQRILGETRGI